MTRAVESPVGAGWAESRPTPQAGWAKAPDFTDDPQRREAVARATNRDRDHYLRGGMGEIECRSCHACVLVKKTSPHHTSVQWNAEARAKCDELEAIRREGGNSAMMRTCPRLSASIAHGVSEGIIPDESPVSDPDGYW